MKRDLDVQVFSITRTSYLFLVTGMTYVCLLFHHTEIDCFIGIADDSNINCESYSNLGFSFVLPLGYSIVMILNLLTNICSDCLQEQTKQEAFWQEVCTFKYQK